MSDFKFKETSDVGNNRLVESPLGQTANACIIDKPLNDYDKPLGVKAKEVPFTGIKESIAYPMWNDGVNDPRELDSKVYLSMVDELCRDWGLSRVKAENTITENGYGTAMWSSGIPFIKDKLTIEVSQEWNDALRYGNKSPILSAGHETAHHAINDFRARAGLTRLQEEMFADRFAVFAAALENIDLRDEVIALRSDSNNSEYPNGDMTIANANQAYDLAEKYKGTDFTPTERRGLLKNILTDFSKSTNGVTTDNYQQSDWFQAFEKELDENANKQWQLKQSENVPEIFSVFNRHNGGGTL